MLDDIKALETAMWLKADTEMAKAELQRRAIVQVAPGAGLPDIALKPLVDDAHMARFPDLKLDDEIDKALADLEATLGNKQAIFQAYNAGLADEASSALPDIERIFGLLDDPDKVDPQAAETQLLIACARALKLPEGSMLHDIRCALDALAFDALDIPTDETEGGGGRQEMADLMASIRNRKIEPDNKLAIDPANLFQADPLDVDNEQIKQALQTAGDALKKVVPPKLLEGGDATDPIGSLVATLGKIVPSPEATDTGFTVVERLKNGKMAGVERLNEAEPDIEEAIATTRRMVPTAIFPTEAFLPGVAERLGDHVRKHLAAGHDFKGGDLAGAVLRGIDFSELDLSATFFEQADLTGARFDGTNLEGAALTGAILDGADLTGARLSKANLNKALLRGARLDGCEFNNCTIIGADFSRASLHDMRLSTTTLIDCTFDEADFSGSEIRDLQLLQGSADGLVMAGSTIERAAIMALSMKGASFANSRLERVAFAQIDAPGISFVQAQLRAVGFLGNCDLSGGRFQRLVAEESSWNAACLVESCFLRAHCHSCLFNGCDMTASDLRLASMKNSRFGKSTLTDSDLFGANFFAASLAQSDLRRSSLRGANLYFTDLLEAKLASCDLSGANLGKTLLDQATHA
ncbi:pentapeptide repeat-containing protein [Mesorhizobium sp. PL10]